MSKSFGILVFLSIVIPTAVAFAENPIIDPALVGIWRSTHQSGNGLEVVTLTQHADGKYLVEITGPNGRETEEGRQEGNFGEITKYHDGDERMAGYSFENGTDTVIFESPNRHKEIFQRLQRGEPATSAKNAPPRVLPSNPTPTKIEEPKGSVFSSSSFDTGAAAPDSRVTIEKSGMNIHENGNDVEFRNDGSMGIETGNSDFDRGVEALLAERTEEAISRFTSSLNSDPTNPQAYLNRSEAHISRKEYREAADDATKAMQLSSQGWLYRSKHSSRALPDDPLLRKDMGSAFVKRGLARQELNQKDLAFEDFQQALQYGVNDSFEAELYSGQFEFNRGANEKAAAYYDAAIKLRPGDGMARCLRGLVAVRKGDDVAADADFAEAARLNANFKTQCDGYAASIRKARNG